MRNNYRWIIIGCLLLFLGACASDDKKNAAADSSSDSSADVADTSVGQNDASGLDQSPQPDKTVGTEDLADMSPPPDQSGQETSALDTAVQDTAVQDTTDDTTSPDTASPDVADGTTPVSDTQTDDVAQTFDVANVSKIYIYPHVFQTAGAIGDRKFANASCGNTSRPSSCTTVIALISLVNDPIKNFAANYGVPMNGVPLVAIDETPFATDMAEFLGGKAMTHSLASAGILKTGEKWFSFSTIDGSYDLAANCKDGSTSDKDRSGRAGLADSKDHGRISGEDVSCTETIRMLCICF